MSGMSEGYIKEYILGSFIECGNVRKQIQLNDCIDGH